MAFADREAELREWLDRLAIQDVILRYSDAATRADWHQCQALFAPQAIWESPALGMRFEDRASFMEALTTSAFELLIMTSNSPVIKLTGPNSAQATTTIYELIKRPPVAQSDTSEAGAENNLEQYGIYFDDLQRIEGEWKFTHKLFVPVYVRTGCVTGNVQTQRSELLRPDPASERS